MDESRRCTAHKKDGEQCKKAAIKGGTVCGSHGGGAPQVRRSARERLLAAAEPAAARLARAVRSGDEAVAVRASQLILDRAGLHPSIGLTGGDGPPIQMQASTIPIERLSVKAQREILAILERELGEESEPQNGNTLRQLEAAYEPAPKADHHLPSEIEGEDSTEADELTI